MNIAKLREEYLLEHPHPVPIRSSQKLCQTNGTALVADDLLDHHIHIRKPVTIINKLHSLRSIVTTFAEPDPYAIGHPVYVTHQRDLHVPLSVVALVDADAVSPEYDFLVWTSKIPQSCREASRDF
ncbi:hypothetical protein Ct61P_12663 [Colletotrichum tofieldiae]|nr:hypothetical protein Ct61P_12663 [Colletotrichum tofieldiae]